MLSAGSGTVRDSGEGAGELGEEQDAVVGQRSGMSLEGRPARRPGLT